MDTERSEINRCHRCEKELKDGDTAYLQKMTKIQIQGKRVTENDIWILRCEGCA